jgi:hypothetical protein
MLFFRRAYQNDAFPPALLERLFERGQQGDARDNALAEIINFSHKKDSEGGAPIFCKRTEEHEFRYQNQRGGR